MAEQEWAGTTYGNAWMHKWLIRMLRHIDVRILYLFVAIFVIPVCLVLNPSRGIAYRYFRRRIGYGRLKSAWKTYVNHCLFGQVVVDKFAMYAGKKFDSLKEYCSRHPELHWGFVRAVGAGNRCLDLFAFGAGQLTPGSGLRLCRFGLPLCLCREQCHTPPCRDLPAAPARHRSCWCGRGAAWAG